MRDDDLASKQIKRLFPNNRGAREFGRMEKIRAVHHDLEPWRFHFIQELAGLWGGIDYICELGFDPEEQVVAFRNLQPAVHPAEEVPPRVR